MWCVWLDKLLLSKHFVVLFLSFSLSVSSPEQKGNFRLVCQFCKWNSSHLPLNTEKLDLLIKSVSTLINETSESNRLNVLADALKAEIAAAKNGQSMWSLGLKSGEILGWEGEDFRVDGSGLNGLWQSRELRSILLFGNLPFFDVYSV